MRKSDRVANVIIDTNVFIYMYELKKDIFEFALTVLPNAKFFVLSESFKEIEKVFSKKPRKLLNLKRYIEKLKELNKFEILEVDKSLLEKYKKVDNLLIYFSNKYIIYTNDKILKSKIKKKGNRVLTLRLHDVFLN
ncbi:MAG TPA: PIN domain-containing protein [archaeon]|jgi:rRNA-processing protein FCF1|nr:PIN domain-containing protein [archaeon]HPV66442.1 PIN domain-containing protein [archaeon]